MKIYANKPINKKGSMIFFFKKKHIRDGLKGGKGRKKLCNYSMISKLREKLQILKSYVDRTMLNSPIKMCVSCQIRF